KSLTSDQPAPEMQGGSIGDPNEIWSAVLKELLASGKRSVHACVTQGHLVSLTNSQAMLRFSTTFPKERTEKDDYRAIVEKMLLQVTGKQVQLICSLASGTQAPKPAVPVAPPITEQPPDPGMDHPAVKQAQMMFGGTVIKIDEQN
ncbi:MAG: DNA polymerase III subunit gamma/tau, partial [Sporomusa sp.]